MNAPTLSTDTAEAWRLWAVLTYRDAGAQITGRRRDIHRELLARDRRRRRTNR